MHRLLLLSLIVSAGALLGSPNEKGKQSAEKNELSQETLIVLKALEERYEKLKMWQAEIQHETYSAVLGSTKLSRGNFVFAHPNLFRFSLNGPSVHADFISN